MTERLWMTLRNEKGQKSGGVNGGHRVKYKKLYEKIKKNEQIKYLEQ